MALGIRKDYFLSEEGTDIMQILQTMMSDSAFNTPSSYSANSEQYPDNQMPFIDKHVNYLNAHPKVDARQYVANIRLMSRVR